MSKNAQKPKSAIELYSPTYFAACTLGGIIGKFHWPVCRMEKRGEHCLLTGA